MRFWRSNGVSGSSVERFAPNVASIPEYRTWRGRLDRAAATPGSAITLGRMNHGIDVRHVLPFINVPTLVMHRKGDRAVNVEHGRYLANHIANARYIELSGEDHAPWVGDTEAICNEIRNFAAGVPAVPPPDMALATILFADAVELAAEAGVVATKRAPSATGERSPVTHSRNSGAARSTRIAGNSLPYSTDQAAQCGALKL